MRYEFHRKIGTALVTIAVYLETGEKRTFAGAIEWPGWCRSGRDEETALQALLDYGPRYERVLRAAALEFNAPVKLSELKVIEKLSGSGTTDFGAPGAAPSRDRDKVVQAELLRYEKLLGACWRQFDAAVGAAHGKPLRSGPRGGGRDLQKMVDHVVGADEAYLSGLGWTFKGTSGGDASDRLLRLREAMLEGLGVAAHGGIPAGGPRGGKRWSPRYFVRRVAWHMLDHAWEIEDREL
jgi:hypothetical protein